MERPRKSAVIFDDDGYCFDPHNPGNAIPPRPEIPSYTFEQLQDLNLPGYTSGEYNVFEVLSHKSDWTPVLSASIFTIDPYTMAKRVLTGVRKSKTHHHVASTPTMQPFDVPAERTQFPYRFERLRHDLNPEALPINAPMTRQLATVAVYHADPQGMRFYSNLTEYMDDLHMYKLGLPSVRTEIGRKAIGHSTVALSSVNIGFSRVGENEDGEQLYEPLVKLVAAELLDHKTAALLPMENEKYAHLGWTEDSDTFASDVANKDVFRLVPIAGDAAVWYCAYGQCLNATSTVTIRDDLDDYLDTEKAWERAITELSHETYERIMASRKSYNNHVIHHRQELRQMYPQDQGPPVDQQLLVERITNMREYLLRPYYLNQNLSPGRREELIQQKIDQFNTELKIVANRS